MASRNEKRYRKIKKHHILGTLIFLFIFCACMSVVLGGLVRYYIEYMLDSKLGAEYRAVVLIADVSQNYREREGHYSFDIVDDEGREFFVEDADGNVIFQNGGNTRSDIGRKVRFSMFSDQVEVYEDSVDNAIFPGHDGQVHMNIGEVAGRVFSTFTGELDVRVFSPFDEKTHMPPESQADIYVTDAEMINMPLWVAVDMGDSGNRLFGKIYFSAEIKDIILLVIIASIVVLFLVAVQILVLTSTIRSLVNQHRMTDIFFHDTVTDGHNWMWFLIKGEQLLRKRRSAKNSYAVLDLVFVNYRNYCVCHSVAEGEMQLKRMNRIAGRSLRKNEICSHYASANFALLLCCNDRHELDDRIKALISELEKTEDGQRISFHVGGEIINPSIDERGRYVRRKQVDLEYEYNNACAARSTLSDRDESAVAFFDNKMFEEQKWVNTVQANQQKALDNNEFVVYYQPKYDPQSGRLKGAEALIRWQSPEFGFVSPGRIIPIFEKNGFITKIDHFMIKSVARDQKKWLDQGLTCVPVSVNVSRAHFIESDLAEQIRDMVDEAGTPHNLIEIELTESAFFDDKKAMIYTIGKLKEYGFTVSMDDFGSGYSSLNSLKDMPLDVLKLDAEFFRGENSTERGRIVVAEAIKLAKSLNMRTVAEGVEEGELDQVRFLADQGCDMIQGYFYAKPMPGGDFEEKMKNPVTN
ncbi:MAG: EAL domain-containing protein [Lachnospiraceae bacterium]|nr:EAL domain-containing protein [Lachnospiraceae bacterium]